MKHIKTINEHINYELNEIDDKTFDINNYDTKIKIDIKSDIERVLEDFSDICTEHNIKPTKDLIEKIIDHTKNKISDYCSNLFDGGDYFENLLFNDNGNYDDEFYDLFKDYGDFPMLLASKNFNL